MQQVAQIGERLRRLKELTFPAKPGDTQLAEWILDLAELDGHYAGLATTALQGGAIHLREYHDLQDAVTRLASIHPTDPADQSTIEHCKLYVLALKELAQALC